MLYGYDRGQSDIIKESLAALTGKGVSIFGGSGREGDTVRDIIEGEPGDGFGPGKVGVLMFLGFDDGQIGAVLDSFPRHEGLPRPIFCTLTENNVEWTISMLLEHLLEEQRYWAESRGNAPSDQMDDEP